MRLKSQPGSGQSGFSLMEVLVASVVTGILAVSAFYFLSAQNKMGLKSNDMLKSVNLGKLKLDSLRVSDWDSLEAGSDTVSERYIRSWNVSQSGGVKKIELTVYWPLTADHSVGLASLLSDYRYKEDE